MMQVKVVPSEKQLVRGTPENWNASDEHDSEGRNPYDARDRLDSYHIVPVILSEISALKELMDSSGDGPGGYSGGAIPPRYSANSGAVLLLRCSDESFDTVMKSLDHQDIQLAIGMLEQQISLEEQTESSLTHLSQLYRQTSMEKFLNTAHALMKSQQRLAWIRSRILRCMSKHLALVSNGQIESKLEPLLKRVLRFPDLAYKYVAPEDAAAPTPAAPSPPQTPLATNGHTTTAVTTATTDAASASPRVLSPVRQAALDEEPPATVSLTPPVEAGSSAPTTSPSRQRDSTSGTPINTPPPPEQQQQRCDASEPSTPQPSSDLNLTAPLVGMLMSRLEKEGVSSMPMSAAAAAVVVPVDRNNNSDDDGDDDEQQRSRRVSGSPPPVNSRSTPAGENGDPATSPSATLPPPPTTPAQLSLASDVFARTPSPLTDAEQPLSPLVSSLLGSLRIVGAGAGDGELRGAPEDEEEDKDQGPVRVEGERQRVQEEVAVAQREPVAMTSPTGVLTPPEPPRRSSSYEVLRKFDQTRSVSRNSSSSRSASQHSSPAKSLSEAEKVPEGFADACFIGNLLSTAPISRSSSSSPSKAPTEDAIEEAVFDETEAGESEALAEPSTGELNTSDADVPQFVGNLSSLMSSRIVFD